MDTCTGMAEFLCYPPETVTTLLNGYTPIQNKKFNLKKKSKINITFPKKDMLQITSIQIHRLKYCKSQ